jgi:hypothetical protein
MLQYKDPEGVLRPIPANYKEKTRSVWDDVFRNILNVKIRTLVHQTYCICNDSANKGRDPKKKWCNKRELARPNDIIYSCKHSLQGICLLSKIDELDLVNITAYEMLPTLLGVLQTEPGIQELEKRLKNVTI